MQKQFLVLAAVIIGCVICSAITYGIVATKTKDLTTQQTGYELDKTAAEACTQLRQALRVNGKTAVKMVFHQNAGGNVEEYNKLLAVSKVVCGVDLD